MSLPEDRQERLLALLRQCLVRVETAAGHGTGFFIAPGTILTAFHVIGPAVEAGGPITVTWGGTPLPATVVPDGYRPTDAQDVALLSVQPDAAQPCVLLDDRAVPMDTRLAAAGFPRNSRVEMQIRRIVSGGEHNWDQGGRAYLRLDDDPIVGGMSGGPVLNLESGFVCGVVRLTLGEQGEAGGFATPVSTIVPELQQLRAALDGPGVAAQPWADILTPLHLRGFGRDQYGARFDAERTSSRMDLTLRQTGPDDAPLSTWEVDADIEGAAVTGTVRGSELGTHVMTAVDLWSQRRLYGKGDVTILGRMLYRALLPQAVEDRLEQVLRGSPPLLLRVRVSPDDPLAQIPWEYAVKDEGEEPLSTRGSVALSRYVDADATKVSLSERLRVLGVIVRPPWLRERTRSQRDPNSLTGTADQVRTAFRRRLAIDRLDAECLVDEEFDDFRQQVQESGPWDAIHYMGYGWEAAPPAEPTLNFEGPADTRDTPLSSVVRTIRTHASCRLVVVQLLATPVDRSRPPLGSRSLLPLLAGGTQALVVGQHASTLDSMMAFNQRFYRALMEGEAVEFAVQKARAGMAEQPPDLDYTAFGTFNVTTTRSGELRLVTRNLSAGRDARPDPAGRIARPTGSLRPRQ
jgi:hypothetical protein